MAIPATILESTKDVLRIPATDLSFHARIEAAYQRALVELTRETDLFCYEQAIATVAEQSLYLAADGTTRILAVVWNGTLLLLVPSRSLDLLTTWQTEEGAEPEEWVADKLPPSIDGLTAISPLYFAIHPPPSVDGSGAAGLRVFRIGVPPNEEPMPWVTPYLIYKTAAIFTDASTEERDPPAAQFFAGLADVWKELITV